MEQDSYRVNIEDIIEIATKDLLRSKTPSTEIFEWDPDDPNNQHLQEEVAVTVDSVIRQINEMQIPREEKQTQPTGVAVVRTDTLQIICDAGEGAALYVSDVKKWLDAVEKAGISDVSQIEGRLVITYIEETTFN